MTVNFRFREIDSLRGLAVLLMVMVYAAATWNPFQSTQTSILAYLTAGLGGLAAPLFVTIFGWGIIRSKSSTRDNLIKASILILLQLVVNLCSPHLYDLFTPGILSLFALLILVKPLILLVSSKRSRMIFFGVFIVSIYLVNNFIINIQGGNDWSARITADSLSTVLSQMLVSGTYPLFPWICYAVVGAFLGRSLKEGGKTLPRNSTTFLLTLIGICYCLITMIMSNADGTVWAHPTKGHHLTFFPANTGFIIASLTGVFIFWLLFQEFNILIFESSGKLSLTIYVIHFIPLTILSNLENERDWTVMEASQAVVLFTTTWLLFAYVWNKLQWLTIEGLIRKLTSR